MLHSRQHQVEVVIIPWEQAAPLASIPSSALLVWPLKGAEFFFTGLCGTCHTTLALPHPFGVRTGCCPGLSALHKAGEGGLGKETDRVL